MSIDYVTLCACGHSKSDHEDTNDGSCAYGWDDFQALDDEERDADACECERFVKADAPDPSDPQDTEGLLTGKDGAA